MKIGLKSGDSKWAQVLDFIVNKGRGMRVYFMRDVASEENTENRNSHKNIYSEDRDAVTP